MLDKKHPAHKNQAMLQPQVAKKARPAVPFGSQETKKVETTGRPCPQGGTCKFIMNGRQRCEKCGQIA